ncbi:MAG: co-chaperone DjlA [Proteobacteria bacterium]|nr:MAG: co-chaperone DjlA [Pseudomonadota bacterium]QKK12647.1 MAG: co-chaperone DjlA [Pseudomonadota bacterium]
MGWWGKLLGGAFGYLIGGPLGAILGAALGHGFDKSLRDFRGNGWRLGDQQRVQTAFFTATFSVMGHICKADGRVSEDEIIAARSVMSKMELNPDLKLTAMRLFTEGKKPGFPLDAALEQFRRECHRRHTLLRLFVEIQLQAALADGELAHEERALLLHICDRLGISRAEFAQLEGMAGAERHYNRNGDRPASIADAYALLGVTPQNGEAEIKKAYRRLLNQHHPDKLVAKGLPEEMMKLAAQKTHEIKSAYEQIKAARGFR